MIEQSHSNIRILVAESFELVRLGLRSLFENHTDIRLVAETSQLDDLFNLAEQHKPDIILMDLLLSGNDYVEHIIQLLHTCPQSKILAFSHHNNEQTHLQTFRSGAVGVISKNNSTDLLLKAIIAIHTGHIWFDRNITKLLWQAQFDSDPAAETKPHTDTSTSQQPRLSDSERHVAHLACKGLSAKEIGAQLFVTEKTVRNQLSVIYRKIGVKKQIELCLKAPLYNYFKESHLIGTFSPKGSEI
ncbi:response regulator transcription factor [Nitrosomonas ureae]|uniref:LuxR family two component transcriptional regulator n=1 Tax=Nitrosomonas ureae TaxID=44577 RepID=A0A0S3AH65_9PROT|nr:response regulator transcription factor [Nitrosomonas ureae]ALQ50521.1 LuxR family transcriptional regulator [Nitrosomonas ureae]PTQ82384.1 LuxR family two component transcriptional regulator [Nitrosomonas ureae]PXX14020.1 LuxR family two component transcriptional regulator [Nitrosomonas ureae]SDT86311.1 two component transcriptional regulator, LuxR family [Nitrosomonas ureae]SEP81791.1 two component transcriptional regulator, LuxR family [Nitrosomonas ureae]